MAKEPNTGGPAPGTPSAAAAAQPVHAASAQPAASSKGVGSMPNEVGVSVPAQGAQPMPTDPNANPVLVNQPGTTRELHAPDKDSNPYASSHLGGPTSEAQPGVLQTTIDVSTTTINPNSSITNPVDFNGQPAPLKRADFGVTSGITPSAQHPLPDDKEK